MNTKITESLEAPTAAEEAGGRRARKNALRDIGTSLRHWRECVAKESQEQFAASIGAHRTTVIEMEKGSAGVAIGTWIAAWRRVGKLKDVVDAATPVKELDEAVATMIATESEHRHSRRIR